MKGFKPYAEIYYKKKDGSFRVHFSTPKFELLKFVGFLTWFIQDLFKPNFKDRLEDTAKPEHRKRLNKKYKHEIL